MKFVKVISKGSIQIFELYEGTKKGWKRSTDYKKGNIIYGGLINYKLIKSPNNN